MNSLSNAKEKDIAKFEEQKKLLVDLLTSAENGDLQLLQTQIEVIKATANAKTTQGVLTSFMDGNKRTAMHFAAAKGRRKVMKFILEQAPECLNIQDEEGSTPLFLAARENEFATVRELLERGADANLAQKNGTTAVHEAAANGSVRTVKLLVEQHNAQVDASCPNGTPLHFAVNEGREKTIEELLALGADVNAKNSKGVTPLILSVMLNKPAIVKTLLAAKADVTVTLNGGITVLHIAAEAAFVDVLKELLEARATEAATLANTKFDGGATPLQLAAGKGHKEIVQLLQPLTTGFEGANIDELMAAEKKKMDTYLAEATKSAPAEVVEETEEEKAKKKILEGVTPEDEIVVPEAKELDEATLAKATALKEDGNKAYIAKEYANAVDFYTQAIALNPADAALYSNRCAAHLSAGDAKKALNDVRVSKKLKPEWAKAHFREGQCLEALGLFEDAAVAMWAAVQCEPKNRTLEKRFQECVARGREHHQKQQQKQSA
ncbi:hypothetical protein Poli38472_010490 [Pythium oligandrum]|uniref:Uncharacterized protein n=1 Tax=Pythium oligandrum TaxID=41045 RepID=A0A8K1C368_PYTOL|nr:hypothetical protein Poli38472_010490 [Pythium oligandrum]|eukprot:TMW55608.1 hypothetical protein Poli38472_010490 [Pythium oligandrum]